MRSRTSTTPEIAVAYATAACLGVLVAPATAQLPAPTTQIVSIDPNLVLANGNTVICDISPTGRFVAFASTATNLIPSDANGAVTDIFMRDRLFGTTVLVSRSGATQGNMDSVNPAVASNAWVAYQSRSTNLASPDTNNNWDIFVTSPLTGQTIMISVDDLGVQGAGISMSPYISTNQPTNGIDGRFIVYQSTASNLVAGDTNNVRDVFRHDRDSDGNGIYDEPGGISTTRATINTFGFQANGNSTSGPVSPSGRFVAYWSNATNLINVDANGTTADVFVRDFQLNITNIATVNSAFTQADDDFVPPPPGVAGPGAALSMSSNGRFVAFSSYATNLDSVTADTNNTMDIFVRDQLFGTTDRVSVPTGIGGQANGRSYNPAMSNNARFIAFYSEATNLPAGPGVVNLYIRDRDADNDGIFDEPGSASATTLVNGAASSLPFLGVPRMSGEGSALAYPSQLGLVAADTNGLFDIFVTDVQSDRDGDGLLDGWEMVGIDVQGEGRIDSGTFLVPLSVNIDGADPDHKDIYIELDAMVGRVPTQLGLNLAAVTFQNATVNNPDFVTGIRLRTQTGQGGVLLVDEANIPLPADGNGDGFPDPWTWPNGTCNTLSPEFCTAKTAFFGTAAERADPNWTDIRAAKIMVYRYGIFADTLANALGTPTTISGLAEFPGNDFMITLGGWPTPGGTQGQQIGLLLHELGHCLGLGHGGGDNINYKPNYHSVMNYLWTVPSPTPPSNLCFFNSWTPGYSSAAWPTLDENNLNELAGIGGHVGHCTLVGPPLPIVVVENGFVDYNGDGQFTGGVVQDINRVVSPVIDPTSGPGTILTGYDDWSNLQYSFIGGNFNNGGEPVVEISYEIVEAISDIFMGDPCPWDIDGDMVVGITDLLSLLSGWGPNPGHPADFDDDGIVGITDLLALLGQWGNCPE